MVSNKPLKTTFLALVFSLGLGLGLGCSGDDAPVAELWGSCESDSDCPEGAFCNLANMCMPRHDASPFECQGDCGAGSAAAYGEVVATYRGVPAYSNGSIYGCHACADGQPLGLTCGYRCDGHYSPETPYGIAYQCVEYIRRFYAEVYGDLAIGDSRGNANDYQGTMVANLGLTEHHNGQTTEIPRPDDILVFLGGSFGHVAIVTQVEPEAQRVWFIQENVPNAGMMWTTYHVDDGIVTLDPPSSPLASYTINAWLRNPQYQLPCSDATPCPESYTCIAATCQPVDCPMPAEPSGVIASPPDASEQSGEFVVSGNVSDDNGVNKVTIAVDTLDDCKFSVSPPDPSVSNYSFAIPVQPGTCSLAPGGHTLGLWMEDGCGVASLLDWREFVLVDQPMTECVANSTCCEPSGLYTPLGAQGPQCLGECNACDGTGGCDSRPPGTPCGNGQGSCDGAGACEVPTCGDGNQTVDPGEQCDGNNLAGQTCMSLGFDQGSLACDPDCTFDTSGCANLPDCQAATYWSPGSISDLDSSGTQYLGGAQVPLDATGIRVEIEDGGMAGNLHIRACKVENPQTNLQNSVRVYFENDNAVVMFDQTLAANGVCTNYGELSGENAYSEGMVLGGRWRVVSPSTSASEWTKSCTKAFINDPTGTCWWSLSVPGMTRTCK